METQPNQTKKPKKENLPKEYKMDKPPAINKSRSWAIRIDALEGVESNLRSWCEKHGVVLATWEHADDATTNPHYHIAMRLASETTRQTITNWIKALLPIFHTRNDFGTKVWTDTVDDEYLAYCCKGPNWQRIKTGEEEKPLPPKVVFQTLLSKSVEELHEQFWKRNAEKGKTIKKKVKTADIVDDICCRVRSEGLPEQEIPERVDSLIMDYYKGKVNDHVSFPIFQGCMYQLQQKTCKSYHYTRMMKKYLG